jgi:hypothetical protein
MKDPKFTTSLYNHKPISDGKKPLISNRQFMLLLERVKAGEHDAYDKAKEHFILEPKQDKMINDIINKRII